MKYYTGEKFVLQIICIFHNIDLLHVYFLSIITVTNNIGAKLTLLSSNIIKYSIIIKNNKIAAKSLAVRLVLDP